MSEGDGYGSSYNDGRPNEYDDYYYSSSYQGSGYRGRGRGGGYRGRGSSYYDSYSSSSSRGGKYYGRYGSYYQGGGSSGRGGRGGSSGSSYTHDTYEGEPHGEEPVPHEGHDTYRGSGYKGSNFREDYRGSYRGSYRGRGNYHLQPHYSKETLNQNDGTTTPKAARETVKPVAKAHNNPWIDTLGIKDLATIDTLEARYNELQATNKDIIELQQAKLKLERSVATLENQASREELHVQLTTEKLDEFTYM
ncbi:uncharacterized protein CANTADRAFT_132645 [Suhomyces tanzawaensis NRRL Y-17324]|uniref:Transcription regulator LGE1 helical region domain-containing protein n=1 Tax=Suhomyces tanzawaensis NRRL Y-17324 TaxID=984487 RepID=A0A1E4SRA1_9ASCO|nr:uncharacterized protein CANTADRAFT_132645 [Suhomyces tanzawaensis NRRL Y-17324]ODV82039.1 hypothetical protein CANTADRAFT_132645 [Suhomyces tanzawaensis NRRL Y-17324]